MESAAALAGGETTAERPGVGGLAGDGHRDRSQCVDHRGPGVAVSKKQRDTTDGEAPDGVTAGAPKPIDPKTGQHGAYYILPEEERAKGYVRPLRYSYVHKKCGALTTMGTGARRDVRPRPELLRLHVLHRVQGPLPSGRERRVCLGRHRRKGRDMTQKGEPDYCILCKKEVHPGPDFGLVNDGQVLHESCRDARDENGALLAIHAAVKHDKKAGLAVDDMIRVPLMVDRVERQAANMNLAFKTKKTDIGTHIRFDKGEVYVFAADKLIPVKDRPN